LAISNLTVQQIIWQWQIRDAALPSDLCNWANFPPERWHTGPNRSV